MALDKIEKLKEILDGKISGEIVDQIVTRLTEPGENFMSLVVKVDIKVKNGDIEETINTVAKLVPPGQLRDDSPMKHQCQTTFTNEINWYKNLVPLFKEFEREFNLEGFTDIYPQYYGGRLNLEEDSDKVDKNAVIILENLQDYRNIDRHIGFDLETTREILKSLSRLHSLSLALRLKRQNIFEEIILPTVIDKPRQRQRPPTGFNMLAGIMEVIKKNPEFSLLVPRFEAALNVNPFESKEIEVREPWGTTVHRDFWINNVMVARSKNTHPKVKILDFQAVMYGSFAKDLVFFLLTSVETSVQINKLDELIRFYYDEFITNLMLFEVDMTKFTYENYLKELEIEMKSGGEFAHAMLFTNIIFADKKNAPDIVMEHSLEHLQELINSDKPKRQQEKILAIAQLSSERNWI